MKKNLFFIAVIVFLFSACQEEDDTAVVNIDDIKISMSTGQALGLKSASVTENLEISCGDTVDIWSMQNVNIVFSAQVNGLPAKGDWSIFLNDADNDTEDFKVGNRPYAAASGPICSIKPSKLGLYYVEFREALSDIPFYFFVRHKGIPGTIGDAQENDFAFRLEKEVFNTQDGQTKIGYSLYLKYKKGDFDSWGDYEGTDPKDENNFKAVLQSAREDYFNDACRGLFAGTLFQLKVCKYSNYVCFTFFEEDFPPMPEEESYRALFYSGRYGCNYWLFPSLKKSDWSDGANIVFTVR